MLSFQTQYKKAQSDATDSVNTQYFKDRINEALKILESDLHIFYTENTRTGLFVANTQSYQLPEDYIRMKKLYVTVGTRRYDAEFVFDEDLWQELNVTTAVRSNYLQKVFTRTDTFEVFPTPSSGNTYTMIYEAAGVDLQNDDYITGSITTLANAGTAVTGSGTTWTSAMIGRYFKINTDNRWYKVTAVGSATTLTLGKAYQGTAIAAGTSAYTIGEMCRLPEACHHIPEFYALMMYFLGVKRNATLSKMWQGQWEEWRTWARSKYGKRYSTGVIPSQNNLRGAAIQNPNFYPSTIG